MHVRVWPTVLAFLLLGDAIARSCSICDPNFLQKPTLRQSARTSKFVVLGTLSNARLDGQRGKTDLSIDQIIQDDGTVGRQKSITVPGYIPFDARKPPKFLVFGDLPSGKIDVVRGSPVRSALIADYLRDSLKIDDRDPAKLLQFCFRHLDSTDPDVAADAFHEFAKASDRDIASVAKLLAPQKIRRLLKDPATPSERLGAFAFLLGACGTQEDAEFLASLIRKKDERGNSALSGLLGGLIELRPEEGWALVTQILRDEKRPFSDKLATLGTLRFFHATRPKEFRKDIVNGLAVVVANGDLADMAVEDLRRWQWWELTPLVLKQYGKPSHAAPLVKRAIIRYALCCPDAGLTTFVNERRRTEANLVKQVEESLEFEKPSPALPKKQQ